MRSAPHLRAAGLLLPSLVVLAALLAQGCLSTRQAPLAPQPKIAEDPNQRQVNAILKTAFSQIGNPYRYGGNTPETGFDCSGFVGWVYDQYGVDLPRSSRDMLGVGEPVERVDLRPGDLVFFNYGYSHVGIYTGDDKYIHSPRTGKSVEEVDLNDTGRGDRFVGGRRVIDNLGVMAIAQSVKNEWSALSRHMAEAGPPAAEASARPAPAARPAARASAPAARVHKVVQGDTLIVLARRYGVAVRDIVAANSLSDRHKLSIGQKLSIPSSTRTAATRPAEAAAAKPAAAGGQPTTAAKPAAGNQPTSAAAKPAAAPAGPAPRIHKVVQGDTLIVLAQRYGVAVRDIVAANSLTDRHKLAIGQKLRIPPPSRTASVKPGTGAARPAAPKPSTPSAKPNS